MNWWNNIYYHFNPIAFNLFGFNIHWYGLMYVTALLVALYTASWIVKKDKLPISKEELDAYFIWVEIGVILGARIGYILFYDPHTTYYLTHPWQIFNPFSEDGVFVGIRGMSYHGALIGFIIGNYLFSIKHKFNPYFLLDISAIAIPAGYFFGRVGNFLNQELFGRETTLPIGINVNGVLRHPSQLYEGVLEGILIFIIIYFYRKRKRFDGELISLYGFLYGVTRFISEFFREPDSQLGFICCGWITMGHFMSIILIFASSILYFYLYKRYKKIGKKFS